MAGWLTLEAMMAACLLMTCGNEQQTCLIALAGNCSVSKALCFPYLLLTALRSRAQPALMVQPAQEHPRYLCLGTLSSKPPRLLLLLNAEMIHGLLLQRRSLQIQTQWCMALAHCCYVPYTLACTGSCHHCLLGNMHQQTLSVSVKAFIKHAF